MTKAAVLQTWGKITFAYFRVSGVSYNKHIAYALDIRVMEQSLSKFNFLKSETSNVVSECEITETKMMLMWLYWFVTPKKCMLTLFIQYFLLLFQGVTELLISKC